MAGRPAPDLPLYRRFPALQSIPRVGLCTLPSPVMSGGEIHPRLWIKRDDLNATAFGGNKARSLEFLLGEVREGDTVLTIGGEGSTHVLATAVHARSLGADTVAMRWKHDMNPGAISVSELISRSATGPLSSNAVFAIARALAHRLRRRVHYVPLGGSTPLGVLAQVNAGLELAEQIAAGELPAPARVVLPLGSGGTTAGLALGFAIAGLDIEVVGARVAPRLAANRRRVRKLADGAGKLILHKTGEHVPPVSRGLVRVVHDAFGGAYGRILPGSQEAAKQLFDAYAIMLDSTYSAKAFVAALAAARELEGPTLFWLTFDGRCLDAG
ncbi:MAG TPA: pyridoxal-phosphate dependent enzyme [Gemmatimonadaceae bacterium]|nr:pyridoxal-phosphate dependent enzyme [Gemmatimonadaceae bacterium]